MLIAFGISGLIGPSGERISEKKYQWIALSRNYGLYISDRERQYSSGEQGLKLAEYEGPWQINRPEFSCS